MSIHTRGLCAAFALLAAVAGPAVVHAEDSPCTKDETAPTRATPESIRERAKAIQALKDLLKDPDASVRLSALESVLTSCNAALREIGYDAGFGSSDQPMRALALKYKLLTMTQFIVELIPPETSTKEQDGLIRSYQLKHPISVGQYDMTTGNFSPQGNIVGTVSGLELKIRDYHMVVRMRLAEGAILMGTVSTGAVTVPARVALR